jgi:flagellar basal-body rod protein FlgF
MSSGMYSALSGALAKIQSLDTLVNNITNAGTPGYKKERNLFESVLNDISQTRGSAGINFTRLQQKITDFSQGTPERTGNKFDLAIEGKGFFKLQGNEGFLFTRLGKFSRDQDGTLVTDSGMKLLGANDQPIELPDDTVEIDSNGRILDQGGVIGQIPVHEIDDITMLQKRGASLYALPPGLKSRVVEEPQLIPGSLEASNVNIMQEMAMMMDSLRGFETLQKVLKTYSEIGSKADEIGSVR